jgi:hypothetical protein
MVNWTDAFNALAKIVPVTPEEIVACRKSLVDSKAPHAARSDSWPCYQVYMRLLKALLMTTGEETCDHAKHYAFAREILPVIRSTWQDDTKDRATIDIGNKWKKRHLKPEVMQSIVKWAIACYALDNPNIEPDPKPVAPPADVVVSR